MARGEYRYQVGQKIDGDNGTYTIVSRTKIKDKTENAINRKWYSLQCPYKHTEFMKEESHLERKKPRCPECYYPKIISVDKEFASMFADPEVPKTKTCMSHEKADFKCPNCGAICKNKEIHTVYQRGFVPCKECGDGRSFGERMFAAILESQNIAYKFQKCLKKEKGKYYYDFDILGTNKLIEINGVQHYEQRGFNLVGGRTLEEEQQNDGIKKRVAEGNGFQVIDIDVRKSNIEYFKSSVSNNEKLNSLIDKNIDWKVVCIKAQTKRDREILELIKLGDTNTEIAQKVQMHIATISNFRQRFKREGLWDGKTPRTLKAEQKKTGLIKQIKELQKQGMCSGDICAELAIRPELFKKYMGIKVFDDPKRKLKWTLEEVEKVIREENLPVKYVSDFTNQRANALWECTVCGQQYTAVLEGIRKGRKCPCCEGTRKLVEYLETNFPGEYQILGSYIHSETPIEFLHLKCNAKFYQTPHSLKRTKIPCLICAEEARLYNSKMARKKKT